MLGLLGCCRATSSWRLVLGGVIVIGLTRVSFQGYLVVQGHFITAVYTRGCDHGWTAKGLDLGLLWLLQGHLITALCAVECDCGWMPRVLFQGCFVAAGPSCHDCLSRGM